ncbi:MAG: GreA/GreB family elongation factor [Verrucomicrobia bacterium]|nr:GreA/GreB family elongation factor [Verrucomicrobiota bacterium]
MTADGARRLRLRLDDFINGGKEGPEISRLAQTLESATIVEPEAEPGTIVFGAAVTLQNAAGEMETLRIVGVDEVDLEPGNVSWVSAIGRVLLGAKLGQRVNLAEEKESLWTVVKAA